MNEIGVALVVVRLSEVETAWPVKVLNVTELWLGTIGPLPLGGGPEPGVKVTDTV